jgi:hypothetical protein
MAGSTARVYQAKESMGVEVNPTTMKSLEN